MRTHAMETPETLVRKQIVVKKSDASPKYGDTCRFYSEQNKKTLDEHAFVDIPAQLLFSLDEELCLSEVASSDSSEQEQGKILEYTLTIPKESILLLQKMISTPLSSHEVRQDLFLNKHSLSSFVDVVNVGNELNILYLKVGEDQLGQLLYQGIAHKINHVINVFCQVIDQACGDFVNNSQSGYCKEMVDKNIQNLSLADFYALLAQLNQEAQVGVHKCFFGNGCNFSFADQVNVYAAAQFSPQNLFYSKNNFDTETMSRSDNLRGYVDSLKKLILIQFLQKIEKLAQSMLNEREKRDYEKKSDSRPVIRHPQDVLDKINKNSVKRFDEYARRKVPAKDTDVIVYNEKLDIEIKVKKLFCDPSSVDIAGNVFKIQEKYRFLVPQTPNQGLLVIPCTMSEDGLNTLNSILDVAYNSRYLNQGCDNGYEECIKKQIARLSVSTDREKMKQLLQDLGTDVQYRANGQLKSVKDLLINNGSSASGNELVQQPDVNKDAIKIVNPTVSPAKGMPWQFIVALLATGGVADVFFLYKWIQQR